MKILGYSAILLLLALLAAGASAYEVTIDAPLSIHVGAPLIVNGTTNLADGVNFDIVLSNADYNTVVIDKKNVVVQHTDENKSFSVVFNTTGLKKGQYKVEVSPIGDYSFLGDSVTLRPVTLVDRSDEITLTSPLRKQYDGLLVIAGNGAGLINSGVEIVVTTANGTLVYGPEFIASDYMGYFSKSFTIPAPGYYIVNLSDARGFIGNFTYTILQPKETPPATTPPVVNSTPTPPTHPAVFAESSASRDDPAIFAVFANPGPVTISTSTGIDWVIEYLDRSGTIHKVHETGAQYPESATFQSDGNTTWVKVYPFKYGDNSTVTLYAENALDIQISKNGADFFPVTDETTSTPETTKKSPLPGVLFIVATGIGIIMMMRKRG